MNIAQFCCYGNIAAIIHSLTDSLMLRALLRVVVGLSAMILFVIESEFNTIS